MIKDFWNCVVFPLRCYPDSLGEGSERVTGLKMRNEGEIMSKEKRYFMLKNAEAARPELGTLTILVSISQRVKSRKSNDMRISMI